MNKNLLMVIIGFSLLVSCRNGNDRKETAVEEKDSTDRIMNLSPKSKVAIKTVGILLYDGYAVLDAMGPYHVLSEMMGVNVFFVGRHKGVIVTGNGMKVQCDTSIAEIKQLDILVIPGGLNETWLATKDTALLNWVKDIDVHSKYTTSVCTGAWILAATGLLKDKDATTHWYGKKILANQFGANVKDKRFVKSGKYWTSAGVSAGIDMSLELVREIKGDDYTKSVMLDLEYDPQPPFTGGSEQKTDSNIVKEKRAEYDNVMEAVIHPNNALSQIKLDNARDPVCGMPITSIGDTASYKGKIFGFCSPSCKKQFVKDPSAFIANIK